MEQRTPFPSTATGTQRPGSTPSQLHSPQSQPLHHITSDTPHKFRPLSRPDAAYLSPLKIPLSNSEGITRTNSVSPRTERTTNRTPTFEITTHRRALSQSEGTEAHNNNPDVVSPRRPHSSSSPNSTGDSTSPRSTAGSGYESSGKLRTATSSMDIFVDDEERNKSRTPRMEVRVERNVLMLDRIAEEEDNIVVNDEEDEAQKQKQLKLQQEKEQAEEEAEESDSGESDSNTNSPYLEEIIDARSSAVEGARMLGDEIGNYMELQRTLLAKEKREAKKSKRKRRLDLNVPFQIPMIHSRSPFSSPLVNMQYSPSPFTSPQEPNLSHKHRSPLAPDGYDSDVGEEIVEVPEAAELADIEEIEEFAETAQEESEFPSPQADLLVHGSRMKTTQMSHSPSPRRSPQLRVTCESSPPATPTITTPHTPSPPTIPHTPRSIAATSRATTPHSPAHPTNTAVTSRATTPHSPAHPTNTTTTSNAQPITPHAASPRTTTPRTSTPRANTPHTSPPQTPSTPPSAPGSSHRVRTVHNVPPLDLITMEAQPTKKPQPSPQNLTQHAYQNMPQSGSSNPHDPYNWDELLEVETLPLPSPAITPRDSSQTNPKQQQLLHQPKPPTPQKPATPQTPVNPQTSVPPQKPATPRTPVSPQKPAPQKLPSSPHSHPQTLTTPHTPHKHTQQSHQATAKQFTPLEQLHHQGKQYSPTKYGVQAESKLFNFLDFLEQQQDDSSALLVTDDALPSPDLPANSSPANVVVDNVKARIVALEVEIDDKAKTIEIMKNTIKQMRTKEQEILAQNEQKWKHQMTAKQQEQQEILQRHLKFIDRLMVDKKELSEKCATLSSELQDSDKRISDKLKEANEQHIRELKKQKESWAAAEKIRRDAWMQDKTKEIKELTIKGLEPEIHKLLAKHKQETKAMEDAHQQELKKAKEEIAAAYDTQLHQWKLKMLHEHKDDIEKEREKNKSLMKENTESLQDMLQQQARKLAQDFREERQKLEDAHHLEKLAYEEKIMRMKNNEELMRSKMQDNIESNYQDLIRKHQTEISVLKEKVEIEREQWMSRTMAKLQQEAKQHEEELRAKLMKERDEEIEMVIARFEEESNSSQTEANRIHEEKMNKLRDKHSAQLNEIKESEKTWKTKYLDVVKTATEKEETIADLKSKVNTLESILAQKDEKVRKTEELSKDLKIKLEQLEIAVDQQKSSIAEKYTYEIKKLQTELEESTSAYASLEESFQAERAELVKQKNAEMEQLHTRIKAAFAKKDEAIQTLKERLHTSELKTKQLELQLDKQRKELLG